MPPPVPRARPKTERVAAARVPHVPGGFVLGGAALIETLIEVKKTNKHWIGFWVCVCVYCVYIDFVQVLLIDSARKAK